MNQASYDRRSDCIAKVGVIQMLGIFQLLPSIRNMPVAANETRPREPLKDRALTIAKERGIARARDFDAAGVPRATLRRLQDQGLLVRMGRGLYQLANVESSASHSLAEAARAVPHGAICLLSALKFHSLTTQLPHQIWLLIGHKKWAPKNPPVSLRIIRATGEALTEGVEIHVIEQVEVPITNPAKTVADCFKYRSQIGLDVAIEALKDCIRTRRATADDLWRFAAIDRVQNVMRPYMEAIL
ncbi:type IV toxin-antitoxin system AbiEi family antitoxin domain-containing protein [Azospirillum sp. B4]|uniref:type IV toxin-antitoxin system AbiEi family antitoxin domain-containing protein n=1 Tax=Azospirillum sp. B4 TaxID=95605 RepID=UPI0018FFBCC5|nr:type IV toxin-antitoxin system AbiEi family antitoxin domain-containing protein [Azospirillum sp. B4]